MSSSEEWDDSSSSRSSALMSSPADLQRQIQKNRDFIGNIHLQEDKKTGDSYVLGMRVPKNLRPVIELGIENAKPYIIDQSENIYKNTTKLAGKLGFKSAATHQKIGVIAENTFRWGIIGAQPIYGIVHASQTYAKERKELFKEFAPVINASKTDYKKNEVIKSAFDRIHDDWFSNLKMVASDIPTLIPMIILGRQDQVAANARRKKLQEEDALKNEIAKKHTDPDAQRRELDAIRRQKALEAARQAKNEFVADAMRNGDFESEKEAAHYFRDNRESDVYNTYLEDLRNSEDKKQHTEGKENDKMFKFLVPIASAVSQIFKSNVEEGAERRKKSINAWKLIQHMKEEVDAQFNNSKDGDNQARSADDIRISLPEIKGGRDVSLKEYIVEIFKQNELDNGRAGLGNNLVGQLQPSVDMIADHIADGSLDSAALLKLVGENKVIVHHGSSRSFASADQVEKAIGELLPVLSAAENIKLEDFFANFADPALIKKVIKGNLDTMKGSERAFFASLFPDPILEQAGMKKKEIVEIRKEIHDRKYAIVAASVAYLAKKDPEELKKWGLPDKDIEAVNELASKLADKDAKAIEAAVDGRDKTIIAAVRTVGLNQQVSKTGDGDAYWANRIKESDPLRTELSDAKKHQKEERNQENADRHRKLVKKSGDEKFTDRVSRESEIDDPGMSM